MLTHWYFNALGMGRLTGVGRLERYQAVPAATAANAARVAGSERKFTTALLPSAIILVVEKPMIVTSERPFPLSTKTALACS